MKLSKTAAFITNIVLVILLPNVGNCQVEITDVYKPNSLDTTLLISIETDIYAANADFSYRSDTLIRIKTGYNIKSNAGYKFVGSINSSTGARISNMDETPEVLEIADSKPVFNIFPNPISDEIKIESDLSNVIVDLYNLDGKIVISKSLVIETDQVNMDLSSLKKGTYIMVIKAQDNVVRKYKVLKK